MGVLKGNKGSQGETSEFKTHEGGGVGVERKKPSSMKFGVVCVSV